MQVGHSEIFGESSGFTQTVLWFWVYKCLVGICQLDIPKRCLTLDTFVLLYMHFLFLRPWRLLIVWSFNACKQCKRNKQPTSHAGRNLVRPYHDDSQTRDCFQMVGSILLFVPLKSYGFLFLDWFCKLNSNDFDSNPVLKTQLWLIQFPSVGQSPSVSPKPKVWTLGTSLGRKMVS